MELKYLHMVKKIIKNGSYQKAASELNYAQSTITFQIKQLESELHVQLFKKNGGRMVLTQAGNELDDIYIDTNNYVLVSIHERQRIHSVNGQ